MKSIRTNLSSKSMGDQVKDLEHLVVSLDLSSKTIDTDKVRVSIKSSPVSYFASLSNHEMHYTPSVVGSSMQDFTPSMSIASITMIDETNGMICFFNKPNHNFKLLVEMFKPDIEQTIKRKIPNYVFPSRESSCCTIVVTHISMVVDVTS
jgi:hypothetical protein